MTPMSPGVCPTCGAHWARRECGAPIADAPPAVRALRARIMRYLDHLGDVSPPGRSTAQVQSRRALAVLCRDDVGEGEAVPSWSSIAIAITGGSGSDHGAWIKRREEGLGRPDVMALVRRVALHKERFPESPKAADAA